MIYILYVKYNIYIFLKKLCIKHAKLKEKYRICENLLSKYELDYE